MYLLKLSVRDFIARAPKLSDELKRNFKIVRGIFPGESEITSWSRSLPTLADVLSHAEDHVKHCLVYLEFGMPGSSARTDALLVGLDRNHHRTAIAIELKQWDAHSIKIDGRNVRVAGILHDHPSDQALGYREYLTDLSEAYTDLPTTIRSCAYLHNTLANGIASLQQGQFAKLTEISPLFAGDQQLAMAKWISSILVDAPDSRYVADLDANRLRISKTLFETVATAVRDEPSWTLLDEQRVAYNEILELVLQKDAEKHLVLVTGGPGTGKSVIAMQLMGELSRRGIPTVHVTNSSSFTTVMQSLIQRPRDAVWGSKAVKGLFRLSHSWVKSNDDFEVGIFDEAHRFRSKTTLYPYLISNRAQAEEIMEHVRVAVAFIDERQRLRKAEAGTVEYFRRAAREIGVKPENIHGPIELTVQFRSAGNEAFVEALDSALYLDTPVGFSHRHFTVNVHDSIDALEGDLQDRINLGYSARLVAGFCWEWSDPNHDGTLVPDVQLDGWARPWNRKAESGASLTPDRHPYTLWARRQTDQLGEVGCIYSVQGFEFDNIGVIWGKDLVWRGDHWEAHPEESFDSEMRAKNRVTSEDIALPLLKNAYRVLCSRGMRGCSIYCMDEETGAFLRRALGEPS